MTLQLLVVSFWLAVCVSAFAADTSIHERAKVSELWEPVPPLVKPGTNGNAPSDAIILFDGSDLSAWEAVDGEAAGWEVTSAGALTVTAGKRDIRTKRDFADVQLHIEWRTPTQIQGDGQGRGNSGVFLMERYEIQVLDSRDNPTYANGQAASIYKQHIPLVNASLGPGEWQVYDIVFNAPRFGVNGAVLRPAMITLLHNGVLVQNHVSLAGPTSYVGVPSYTAHGPGPLRLQDHGNPVSYRNIWLREL